MDSTMMTEMRLLTLNHSSSYSSLPPSLDLSL